MSTSLSSLPRLLLSLRSISNTLSIMAACCSCILVTSAMMLTTVSASIAAAVPPVAPAEGAGAGPGALAPAAAGALAPAGAAAAAPPCGPAGAGSAKAPLPRPLSSSGDLGPPYMWCATTSMTLTPCWDSKCVMLERSLEFPFPILFWCCAVTK